MARRTLFGNIKELFISKECSLLTTEDEYNTNHMTKQDKFKYIARCGHQHEVHCTNFMRGTGIDCSVCALSNALKRTLITSENRIGNKEIIKKFTDIIKDDFEYKLTADGNNLADVFIRPLVSLKTDWLRILIRYCIGTDKAYYSTNSDIPSYVLVGMTHTNRTWIFPSCDINVKKIQIFFNNKNKYDEYEIAENKIIKTLKNYYEQCELVENDDNEKYNIIEYNNFSLSYEEIVERFKNNNCQVLTQKEDYKNTKETKLLVTMSCGHNSEISAYNFTKNKHTICKNCIYQDISKNSYNEIEKVANSNLNESYNSKYIEDLIKSDFYVLKTHEGCKFDIIIKPLNIQEDKWIGIQLKCSNNSQYSFKKIGIYSDTIIICTSVLDNKLWLFDGNDLIGKTSITIGKNKSKYEKNKIGKDTIIHILKEKYEIYSKNTIKEANIPTSISHRKEHENRMFREELLKNKFVLEYPKIDGTKYDIIINSSKVQDKCALDRKGYIYLCVKIYVSNHKNYKKGENDFYWINLPDHNFYIIPESYLLTDNHEIKNYVSLNDTVEEFYYKHDDPLLIEKLLKIFV